MKRLHASLLLVLLTACAARHVSLDPPKPKFPEVLIVRPTWEAVETSKDRFAIFYVTNQAEKEAVAELCQSKKYVCITPSAGGKYITIERRPK